MSRDSPGRFRTSTRTAHASQGTVTKSSARPRLPGASARSAGIKPHDRGIQADAHEVWAIVTQAPAPGMRASISRNPHHRAIQRLDGLFQVVRGLAGDHPSRAAGRSDATGCARRAPSTVPAGPRRPPRRPLVLDPGDTTDRPNHRRMPLRWRPPAAAARELGALPEGAADQADLTAQQVRPADG